jgi:ribose transport system permease protein
MDSTETTNDAEKYSKPWNQKLSGILQFREANVAIAFLILCLFFYWQSPAVFLKPANLAVIMRFIATFGLLAIGELFVIITGGIDLSVGSMTALTGVIVATLMIKGVGFIPPLGIPLAIIIVFMLASLIGLWHGFSVTKMQIPPFIITLGTWLMARGLAAYITRGYPIVFESDFPFLILGQGEVAQIPIMFIVLVVIAIVSAFILNSTTLGRHIYAIGGNIEAARVSGVHVDRIRIFCYITSSFLACLVGIILASRLGQGTPTVGTAYELWAIAAAVIGGTSLFGGEGSVFGVILGAAIMGVMINGMVLINLSSYLQNVILGIVLVIAVTYDTLRRNRGK